MGKALVYSSTPGPLFEIFDKQTVGAGGMRVTWSYTEIWRDLTEEKLDSY